MTMYDKSVTNHFITCPVRNQVFQACVRIYHHAYTHWP